MKGITLQERSSSPLFNFEFVYDCLKHLGFFDKVLGYE